MIQKLDRFSEALQSRRPDAYIAAFFNEMYDEALKNEAYIAEMEYDILSMMLHHQQFNIFVGYNFRLKRSVLRTIKQYRRCLR